MVVLAGLVYLTVFQSPTQATDFIPLSDITAGMRGYGLTVLARELHQDITGTSPARRTAKVST